MNYSLNELYRAIGISKQAVHKYAKKQDLFESRICELIIQVDEIRKDHPGCGVEKMYYILQPDFMGRDKFIEAFMQLGYRLKRKKNYKRTTYSSKIFYPNLIQGLEVNRSSQVWQSDITYLRAASKFYYGVFIIDIYTKEIVRHCVLNHMCVSANVLALSRALKHCAPPDIHHSDRGSQYSCKEYTQLLIKNGSKISMGLSAQENAYAERINRTIKEEYLQYKSPKNLLELRQIVKKAVFNYNCKRPHKSLNYKTPIDFKKSSEILPLNKRKKLTIFNHQQTVNLI